MKGQLHYEAEFVPALLVKNVKFHGGINEIQRATRHRGSGSDDGSTVNESETSSISSSELDDTMNATPTVSAPLADKSRSHKANMSSDTTYTSTSVAAPNSDVTKDVSEEKETKEGAEPNGDAKSEKASEKSEPGLHIGKEDFATHRKSLGSLF